MGAQFMNWYLKALGNCATFSGCARRREYWIFALINAAVLIALFIAITTTGSAGHPPLILSIVHGVFALLVLVPSIAVAVRAPPARHRSQRLVVLDLAGARHWRHRLAGIRPPRRQPGSKPYEPSPRT